ncbi:MAG: hypothetical protein GWO24_28065, partial [Akkermansiaceae bacterium]|nr:hypothetical protein [Akkermansiaceae bacterium]
MEGTGMSEITGRRKPAIDSRDEEAIAGLFSELEHALQRCDGRALPLSIADADDLPTTEADAPTVPDAEGDSLGPYLLHRKIGNLSCGSVWVAEQREPTSRMVVLCVVNPGSDPNGILARFKAEQLTLALLGDRNIPPANSAKPVAG